MDNLRKISISNYSAGLFVHIDTAGMKKFQATIRFDMDDDFMLYVPAHRTYINQLIEKGIIDQYVVSMESQRIWITFTAPGKEEVSAFLSESPLRKYFQIEIDELFVIDGIHYRLPSLQLN